ncbi:hypothetical protein HMPREF2943_02540 [Corynebacterium sp. HMSC072D12]|nr:hypothetical protein HMPREF2781_11690 [Corynebacterium sp. HMSC062A03]OFQ34304.1 hypothetical protein HMPREF2943_02540 [Corynebacterium sp. HMSC072D12]
MPQGRSNQCKGEAQSAGTGSGKPGNAKCTKERIKPGYEDKLVVLAPLNGDSEPGTTKVQHVEERNAGNDDEKPDSVLPTRVEVSPLRPAAAGNGFTVFWDRSE